LSALRDVLAKFARRGIRIRMAGTAVKVVKLSPRGALDKNLLERARSVKDDLIRMLSRRPETCSKECYEVEPGCWIHRPWAGCATPPATTEAPRKMAKLVCWHCLGEKRCNCSDCSGQENACRVCARTGRVQGWVQ
jgi:hypothetical protein